MVNLNKCTKTKPKSALSFKNCVRMCVRIIVCNCCTQCSTEQFW